MLLHRIHSTQDPLCALISDDPVRPEIPIECRVSVHSEIFVLLHEESLNPGAVVCVHYKNAVPATVEELLCGPAGNVAVFYTIWSYAYASGSGRALISGAAQWIRENRCSVQQFVTLSPVTDQARNFHLRNGASVYRSNATSVNYMYAI